MFPFPTDRAFAPQAKQFLAVEDATRGLVELRITQGAYDLSVRRRRLRLTYGAPDAAYSPPTRLSLLRAAVSRVGCLPLLGCPSRAA